MARTKLGYFTGKTFWRKFDDQRAEYPADTAQLVVWQDEERIWVGVCEPGEGGDPINDSHPCPGSPGC